MSARAARAARLAWAAAALAVPAALVNLVLTLQPGALPYSGAIVADVGVLLLTLTFSVFGALIVSRQPGLSIGWLYVAFGLLGSVALLEERIAPLPADAALRDTLIWIGSLTWIPIMFIILGYLPLLFPNGRLPSPRWQPLLRLAHGWLLVFTAWSAVRPGRLRYPFADWDNPFGIKALAGVAAIGELIILPLGLAVMVSAATSAVWRFRRARGVERQQLKWFAAGAAVLVLYTAAIVTLILLYDVPTATVLVGWAFPLALAAIPLATTVAILRYRLYDVDVVINRALVYGVLTATLALAYWSGVVLLQQVLRPFTQGSDLAIVGSTLLVAALFRPARQRIQAAVDRRFYRQKYDAARTLESFGAWVREHVELDSLATEIETVVRSTMHPTHTWLWLRTPGPSQPPRRGQGVG